MWQRKRDTNLDMGIEREREIRLNMLFGAENVWGEYVRLRGLHMFFWERRYEIK